MMLERARRIEVGVPALPTTFEIGLAAGFLDTKSLLYDGLVGYSLAPYDGDVPGAAITRQNRFSGRLAESWRISDDGRTITMTLRDGVRSVAGKLLDADDVLYTFRRGFHVPGYYQWTAQVGGLASWEDVTAIDHRTVQFHLALPCPYFLDTRVIPLNGIFDSGLLQDQATEDDPWALRYVAARDAGFGPYSLEETVEGEWQSFRARADYYRGKPWFDQVVYRVIQDGEEREHRMASGELDYAHGLSTVQYLRLRQKSGVRVIQGPSTSSFHLSLRCRDSAFADVHLRRAVAWALPYTDLLAGPFQGVATRWQGHIPAIIPGYAPALWPYETDLARSREELAASRAPAKPVEVVGSLGDAVHEAVGPQIVDALLAIGLEAVLALDPLPVYVRRRSTGDFDALLSGATPQVPDPGYALSHDYCSDSEGNDFGYSNLAVDALVRRGLSKTNPAARIEAFREAQRILADEVPVVPIASLGFLAAVSRRLGGVAWYPSGFPRYSETFPAG